MYLERVDERAASEPGIVVEVVMHRAKAGILQQVGNAGWRSGKNANYTMGIIYIL